MNRLFISFSGGETSAMMTHFLLTKWHNRFGEAQVVFANTGQESEETLEFVRDCDENLNFNVVWVEAVIHHDKYLGATHRIVDFETANRDGSVFEEMIKKYGIPNTKYPHCTRELKMNAMRSYIYSLGWEIGEFQTAVGIRADEAHRRAKHAEKNNIIYPLLDWEPHSKPHVNSWWRDQPFRLNLMGYQGNCRWCWKKSLRKHMTIMDDDPRIFDFPERMENQYGMVNQDIDEPRSFFRQKLSTSDLRNMYVDQNDAFERAENDAIIYDGRPVQLDLEIGDGCTESCEATWEEEDVA